MRTEIGHFAIDCDKGRFEFYPTFKNIRKICDPGDMPTVFSRLHGRELLESTQNVISHVEGTIFGADKAVAYAAINKSIQKAHMPQLYRDAVNIMQSCCDDDISPLVGSVNYSGGKSRYRVGLMKLNDMLHFSRSLMLHGVVGAAVKDEKPTNKKGKASDTIDVYQYVDVAMAHLEMPYHDAENLTKTEFDRLVSAKYPDKKSINGEPTDEEYEESMAWLDRVDAKRAK